MKILKIIGKCLATVLSLVLFALFITTMALFSSKEMITKENLSVYIKDAKVLNMDINVLFNKEESGITLKEKISQMAIEVGIPREITEDILKSDEINEFLGDFFSKTIIYIINGGDKPQISNEVTDKMASVAVSSLEEHINIMIEEEELKEYVYKYSDNLTRLIPERNEIIDSKTIEVASYILNFNNFYLYIAIFANIILICLFLLSFYKTIKYVGIPMLLSGILFVVLGCMNNLITQFVLNNINGLEIFIVPLITSFLTIVFKVGILFSFSGLLLTIIYIVLNRIIVHKRKKQILEQTKRINIEDIKIK